MDLIIAEKYSLAQKIIGAIGSAKFKSQDGYFESGEYLVTWTSGHLFGLLSIEEYHPQAAEEGKQSWSLTGLPFCPEEFKFGIRKDQKTKKPSPAIRKQFDIIKKLCARKDITCIIHAGDSDREGEIIVRIVLDEAGNKKPVKRLWLPDQTPQTILSGLRHAEDDSKYDALANEGYSRMYIDWLYGVNLTRLATIKSGKLLRVGRVIVPIVKAIYDRDMAIRNFTPEKYWGLASKAETNGIPIELKSKKSFAYPLRSEAEALCAAYNAAGATVKEIKTSEKTIQSGKLYSLTKLQGVLGKKFKMSPMESLDIIQSLYEAGYVTYPRTNSEYLATAEAGKINQILDKLQAQGYKVVPKDLKKSIYDDSKIESHSALTPTSKLASQADLKEREWLVYSTILHRFLAVFCAEDCLVNHTIMTIGLGGDQEVFTLQGDVFITKGWMQYDDPGRSDKLLPQLKIGDRVSVAFQPVEKETQPPKHYTVETLGNYLTNPFRSTPEREEESSETDVSIPTEQTPEEDAREYQAIFEGVEIGTEATRTSIIENAIASKYISLKNNVYTILPDGEYLIQALHQLGIHMEKEKTAELGRVLKRVYRGELCIEESVTSAFEQVRSAFACASGVSLTPAATLTSDAPSNALGPCPKCGCDVIERSKLYGCTNKECRFAIWKDDKFFMSLGKPVTPAMVKSLLSKRKVSLKNCTSRKTGKKYGCLVTADFTGTYPKYSIQFNNNSK